MHKATGALAAAVLIVAPGAAAAQAAGTAAAPTQATAQAPAQAGAAQGQPAQHQADRPRYRHIALPTRPCRSEDSPGPCVWDAGLRGNGQGASFWRDVHGHLHYLDNRRDQSEGWHPPYDRCHYDSSQPEPRACEYPFTYFRGWKRVSSPMSDALAEGEYGTERDWTRCIEHVGDTTYIVCPDGFETTS